MLSLTVCELPDDRDAFEDAWLRLVRHIRDEHSDLLVLPEMPFAPWLAASAEYLERDWEAAVESHERWLARLGELAKTAVLGSRPVTRNGRRLNEGFMWTADGGLTAIHHKHYLPNEAGFWEGRWYQAGERTFVPATVAGVRIGMTICTDMWALNHAIDYGRAGVQLIVTPRSTGRSTVEKWITGARTVAIVSGAYSASSNWAAAPGSDGDFGGTGWIIDPDGAVLARTGPDRPFVTMRIDLTAADEAKATYPRYALSSKV